MSECKAVSGSQALPPACEEEGEVRYRGFNYTLSAAAEFLPFKGGDLLDRLSARITAGFTDRLGRSFFYGGADLVVQQPFASKAPTVGLGGHIGHPVAGPYVLVGLDGFVGYNPNDDGSVAAGLDVFVTPVVITPGLLVYGGARLNGDNLNVAAGLGWALAF